MRRLHLFCCILVVMAGALSAMAKGSKGSTHDSVVANRWVEEGRRLYAEERYPQAMKMFVEGMKMNRRVGNDHGYCVCTGFIANIYNIYNDYTKALHYFNEGYDNATRADMKVMQLHFLINMVKAYCQTGDIAKARDCYERQKALLGVVDLPEEERVVNRYFCLYNEARIMAASGNVNGAIALHERALDFARKNHMEEQYVLFQNSEIALHLLRQGRNEEAIALAKVCLDDAKRLGNREIMANSYSILTKASQYANRTTDFLHYKELYRVVADSVYNVPDLNTASSMLYEYEEERNREQISSLTNRITQQWYIIMAISLFMVVLMVLAGFILHYYNRLRNTQRLLLERNRNLQVSNSQYQLLLEKYVNQLKAVAPQQDDGCAREQREESALMLDEVKMNMLQQRILSVVSDREVIANPDFSLAMLATAVGSNTKYVSMVINEMYGKNFKTILNEQRIHEAERRLVDRDKYGMYTIQAIYESVGYTNAVSFIRAFKKVNGMTPSEYQKLAEED